jgi:hypothetical protein
MPKLDPVLKAFDIGDGNVELFGAGGVKVSKANTQYGTAGIIQIKKKVPDNYNKVLIGFGTDFPDIYGIALDTIDSLPYLSGITITFTTTDQVDTLQNGSIDGYIIAIPTGTTVDFGGGPVPIDVDNPTHIQWIIDNGTLVNIFNTRSFDVNRFVGKNQPMFQSFENILSGDSAMHISNLFTSAGSVMTGSRSGTPLKTSTNYRPGVSSEFSTVFNFTIDIDQYYNQTTQQLESFEVDEYEVYCVVVDPSNQDENVLGYQAETSFRVNGVTLTNLVTDHSDTTIGNDTDNMTLSWRVNDWGDITSANISEFIIQLRDPIDTVLFNYTSGTVNFNTGSGYYEFDTSIPMTNINPYQGDVFGYVQWKDFVGNSKNKTVSAVIRDTSILDANPTVNHVAANDSISFNITAFAADTNINHDITINLYEQGGTTTLYGSVVFNNVSVLSPTTSAQVIGSLSPGIAYDAHVDVTDNLNGSNTNQIINITTLDDSPPLITNVRVEPGVDAFRVHGNITDDSNLDNIRFLVHTAADATFALKLNNINSIYSVGASGFTSNTVNYFEVDDIITKDISGNDILPDTQYYVYLYATDVLGNGVSRILYLHPTFVPSIATQTIPIEPAVGSSITNYVASVNSENELSFSANITDSTTFNWYFAAIDTTDSILSNITDTFNAVSTGSFKLSDTITTRFNEDLPIADSNLATDYLGNTFLTGVTYGAYLFSNNSIGELTYVVLSGSEISINGISNVDILSTGTSPNGFYKSDSTFTANISTYNPTDYAESIVATLTVAGVNYNVSADIQNRTVDGLSEWTIQDTFLNLTGGSPAVFGNILLSATFNGQTIYSEELDNKYDNKPPVNGDVDANVDNATENTIVLSLNNFDHDTAMPYYVQFEANPGGLLSNSVVGITDTSFSGTFTISGLTPATEYTIDGRFTDEFGVTHILSSLVVQSTTDETPPTVVINTADATQQSGGSITANISVIDTYSNVDYWVGAVVDTVSFNDAKTWITSDSPTNSLLENTLFTGDVVLTEYYTGSATTADIPVTTTQNYIVYLFAKDEANNENNTSTGVTIYRNIFAQFVNASLSDTVPTSIDGNIQFDYDGSTIGYTVFVTDVNNNFNLDHTTLTTAPFTSESGVFHATSVDVSSNIEVAFNFTHYTNDGSTFVPINELDSLYIWVYAYSMSDFTEANIFENVLTNYTKLDRTGPTVDTFTITPYEEELNVDIQVSDGLSSIYSVKYAIFKDLAGKSNDDIQTFLKTYGTSIPSSYNSNVALAWSNIELSASLEQIEPEIVYNAWLYVEDSSGVLNAPTFVFSNIETFAIVLSTTERNVPIVNIDPMIPNATTLSLSTNVTVNDIGSDFGWFMGAFESEPVASNVDLFNYLQTNLATFSNSIFGFNNIPVNTPNIESIEFGNVINGDLTSVSEDPFVLDTTYYFKIVARDEYDAFTTETVQGTIYKTIEITEFQGTLVDSAKDQYTLNANITYAQNPVDYYFAVFTDDVPTSNIDDLKAFVVNNSSDINIGHESGIDASTEINKQFVSTVAFADLMNVGTTENILDGEVYTLFIYATDPLDTSFDAHDIIINDTKDDYTPPVLTKDVPEFGNINVNTGLMSLGNSTLFDRSNYHYYITLFNTNTITEANMIDFMVNQSGNLEYALNVSGETTTNLSAVTFDRQYTSNLDTSIYEYGLDTSNDTYVAVYALDLSLQNNSLFTLETVSSTTSSFKPVDNSEVIITFDSKTDDSLTYNFNLVLSNKFNIYSFLTDTQLNLNDLVVTSLTREQLINHGHLSSVSEFYKHTQIFDVSSETYSDIPHTLDTYYLYSVAKNTETGEISEIIERSDSTGKAPVYQNTVTTYFTNDNGKLSLNTTEILEESNLDVYAALFSVQVTDNNKLVNFLTNGNVAGVFGATETVHSGVIGLKNQDANVDDIFTFVDVANIQYVYANVDNAAEYEPTVFSNDTRYLYLYTVDALGLYTIQETIISATTGPSGQPTVTLSTDEDKDFSFMVEATTASASVPHYALVFSGPFDTNEFVLGLTKEQYITYGSEITSASPYEISVYHDPNDITAPTQAIEVDTTYYINSISIDTSTNRIGVATEITRTTGAPTRNFYTVNDVVANGTKDILDTYFIDQSNVDVYMGLFQTDVIPDNDVISFLTGDPTPTYNLTGNQIPDGVVKYMNIEPNVEESINLPEYANIQFVYANVDSETDYEPFAYNNNDMYLFTYTIDEHAHYKVDSYTVSSTTAFTVPEANITIDAIYDDSVDVICENADATILHYVMAFEQPFSVDSNISENGPLKHNFVLNGKEINVSTAVRINTYFDATGTTETSMSVGGTYYLYTVAYDTRTNEIGFNGLVQSGDSTATGRAPDIDTVDIEFGLVSEL